ncbi:DUF4886 domain-containing protein [Clostridium thermosuccinogenes]|uniref:DUF4886 domain-containing protein n=1 Tax=Clostridium thermosuccinogenes TaxID=84032 RepID=UPI000CCC87A7|nr:DUF4886 domain-containing protein [Pseudoclostridium thermosuccinogenes]PNT92810.1 hypothetical protein CDQ83_04425 [Pseudoclostridium thermosuccinogenes]
MIKVIAIGNSFSVDAVEYLRDIAAAGGVDMLVGNLYIGGCSLKTHWNNACSDAKAYIYYRFDKNTREEASDVSIREALESEEWDIVTMQQASYDSGVYGTYEPYLSNLSRYVRNIRPMAEQVIHQTWTYEIDSDHEGFLNYNKDQLIMFNALKDAYSKAAKSLGARIIPCGEAIQKARASHLFDYANGGKSLCRDGFHASIPQGRYLLGAVWYEFLTGISILENPFVPYDENTSSSPTLEELAVLKQCAHEAVLQYR